MTSTPGAMRVLVVELPATWGRPEEQLARVERALASASGAELVLLPEACLTGYVSPRGDFDVSRFAEERCGPTERALADLALRHRTTLVGPAIERVGECVYNTMIAFSPQGREVLRYRKRHPWYPEAWATPGSDPHPLVTIGSLRVTVATCFDIHFVEDEAAEVLAEADLLLFPSAWVEDVDSRPQRLSELARAHGVSIANANWGPGEPRVAGQGRSAIWDGSGATRARESDGRAGCLVQPRSSS